MNKSVERITSIYTATTIYETTFLQCLNVVLELKCKVDENLPSFVELTKINAIEALQTEQL